MPVTLTLLVLMQLTGKIAANLVRAPKRLPMVAPSERGHSIIDLPVYEGEACRHRCNRCTQRTQTLHPHSHVSSQHTLPLTAGVGRGLQQATANSSLLCEDYWQLGEQDIQVGYISIITDRTQCAANRQTIVRTCRLSNTGVPLMYSNYTNSNCQASSPPGGYLGMIAGRSGPCPNSGLWCELCSQCPVGMWLGWGGGGAMGRAVQG